MAAIDYGTGPNTPTGDLMPAAITKLQARLIARGFDPGSLGTDIASALAKIEVALRLAEAAYTPGTVLSLTLTGTPPGATVGVPYYFAPSVSYATGSVTFTLNGTLPAGLVFDTTTGAISGTPTTAATSLGLSIGAVDAKGSAQLSVSIVIAAVGGGTPTPTPTPTLNALTVSPSSATTGTAYSGTIAGLTSGSSIALSGAGAAGLTIAGGVITGTPTTAGAANIVETLAGATFSPRTSNGVVTVAASTTLNTLSFAQTAARKDTAYTGVPVGKTTGSTLTASSSDSTALTVSSNNVLGTFTVKGSKVISVTETLSGFTTKTTPITLPVLDAKLAIVGDSIGGGFGSDGGRIFWNQMPSFPAFIVNNGSGNGLTINSQISNVNSGGYDSWYDATKTCIAYIEVGTNSLGSQGQTASTSYSQMTTLIGLFKARGWYVVVATVLPRLATTANPWSSAQAAERITYNNLVRANSGGADGIYDAAANPTIGDGANATGNTALYVDGLHLSGLAHVAYGQGMSPTIVNMALSAPRAASGSSPTIAFSATTGSITEGGTVSNVLNVTRNGVTGDLVVNLTYTGTATSGSDYTAVTSATILAANSSVTFNTVTIDDVAVEDLETIVINAALAAYPSATASKTISVSDNDVASPGTGTAVGPNLTDNSTTYGTSMTGFGQARTGGFGSGAAAGIDVLPAGGTTYTIEGWFISPSISAGVQALFGIGNRGWLGIARNTGQIIALYFSGVSRNYGGTGTSGSGTNPVVTDGVWHHVAFVANGAAGVSLYLDGALVGATEPNQVATGGNTPFQIGAFNSSSIFTNGSIDEVAVFTTARYTANFTPPTAPYTGNETGLVALYHLDGNTNAAIRP